MRRGVPAVAVLLALAAASGGRSAYQRSSPAPTPAVVLEPNLLRNTLGTTLNWVDDGDGLGLSRPAGAPMPADWAIRNLGYHVVRVPGGYLARRFDWAGAVSPDRPMQRDFAGHLQAVLTGLPEFKRFAARFGISVMYTLNLDDPPERVAALIRTWDSLPPQGQSPIEWVELGNEEYDRGPTAAAAAAYVTRALPVARAVRAAAPTIRIAGILDDPVNAAWDSIVVTGLGASVDFLVWHRYVPSLPHDSSEYVTTREAFARADSETGMWSTAPWLRGREIWLNEYNISYKVGSTHQNLSPEPRTSLLLGDFVALAVLRRMGGLMKCCLANPQWHLYADVNFSGSAQPQLTNGGVVQTLLNRWIEAQDSIGLWVPEGSPWWRRSVLVGRGRAGTSLLVQNHDSIPFALPAALIGTRAPDSVTGLRGHGPQMWTVRGVPSAPWTADPYTVVIYHLPS